MAPDMVIWYMTMSFNIFHMALTMPFRQSPELQLENSLMYILGQPVVHIICSDAHPPSLWRPAHCHRPSWCWGSSLGHIKGGVRIICTPGTRFTIMCIHMQKIWRMQVLQLFVRAIHYQLVKKSYICAAHDDCILFIERLLQWVCSLSSVFGLSVYFLNDKNVRIWPSDCL